VLQEEDVPMKSVLWRSLMVCGLVLALTAVWGCGGGVAKNEAQRIEREATLMENRAPELEITAQALAGAYAADEAKADEAFRTKVVQLTGIVRAVGVDVAEQPYVLVGEDESLVQILPARRYHKRYRNRFDKKFDRYYQQIPQLQPGESVSFKGTCAGLFDHVIVRGAVLAPPAGSL